jgi:diaminopimelate epimerase
MKELKKHINHTCFTKMHSNGNDFMVIDRIANDISMDLVFKNIKKWSDRNTGIGFDGVIVVEPPNSTDIDFCYRIINSSGDEIGQCGNGAVCFATYVYACNYCTEKTIKVKILNRKMTLVINEDDTVSVDMGTPILSADKIPCKLNNSQKFNEIVVCDKKMKFACVSMGNPHAVTIVEDIKNCDVDSIGRFLQTSDYFPSQVNVGFMQIIDKNNIDLRVFERGVGETKACGSGSCAAVFLGFSNKLLDSKVRVNLLGGSVEIDACYGHNNSIEISSRAEVIFVGKVCHE